MGLTKPIEQNKLSYQGTFMYLKNIIRGDMYMKIMESFLTFFYILDQCYEQCQEDDLGGLLGAISPEIWEDGQPMDKAIFNDWKELSNLDTVHEQNIIEKVSEFLDYYEKEFGFKFAEAKKWLNKADSQGVKNAISKSCVMYEKYAYND